MNSLSEYAERENYLVDEVAEQLIRVVEPIANKSDREKAYLVNAALTLWRPNYNNKDYKACLPYQKIISKYDPETADSYKVYFDAAVKRARTQR